MPFLNFPHASNVAGAARADAFAWSVVQGRRSIIRFARAPEFTPVTLFSKTDGDGAPISSVALSADSRVVVFQTGEPKWGETAYNPASLIEAPELTLWALRTEQGSQPVKIGPGSAPHFAPEGARLFYRHGADLYAVDTAAATIESRVLAPGRANVVNGEWSPDGSALAFIEDRGAYAFIGLYKPGADRIEWLVTGADRVRTPRWSPDGRRLAYLRFAGLEHSKVYDLGESEAFSVEVLDIADKHSRVLWRAPGPATFPYFNAHTVLAWAGNDSVVFYSEHDGWGRQYSVAANGGQPVALTPAGCEVAEGEMLAASQLLVVHNCPDLDTRHLSVFDVRTRVRTDILSADLMVTRPVRSAGQYIAFTGSTADSAPLLRILEVRSRKIVFTERPADFGYQPKFTTAAPRAVTFPSEDGVTVRAQLFLPNTRGKHPAVVWFHGGPYTQTFPAFPANRPLALMYAMNRELAARGYVVLSVNYRGSQGYGLKFRQDDERAWRGASEVRDSAAAARWLVARPDVDAKHIGVWGGSYGGLMTVQSLSRHSDLYAAGVALYGLYDWSYSSHNSGFWDPPRDYGVTDATREQARRSSPVGALESWKSPVLLFTGDVDIYVDVAQTVDLAQRLRARGVDVTTTVIPDESHGFVMHRSAEQLWREMSSFFGEHLGGGR